MNEKPTYEDLERRLRELEKADMERKKAVKADLENEARYRSFVQNFQGIAFRGSMNFVPTFFHGAVQEITGYTEREFLNGKPRWDQIIHEEDLPLLFTEDEKRLHIIPQYSYEREYRIVRKDGAIRWVHEIIQNICGDSGKPTNLQGTIHDITERKRAEEALRESEDKYKSLTNNLNVGIYRNTVGPKGKFLEANPAIVKMFGFDSREEFLKVRVSDLYSNSSDRNEFSAKILKAGAVRNEELPLVKRNGTLFMGSVSAVVVKDDKGEAKYYDGIIEDITERKRTDEELRENEFFLKETQRVARLGGWKLNPEIDFLAWTEGVYDIVEAPLDYKPGLKEGLKYYVPEYLPALQERIQRCYTHGDPFAEECELITESGKRLWTEVRGVARIVEGKTAYVYGTFQDITERKQAQEALKESEKKYRQIYNNIIDVYYEANIDGIILEISPSIEKNSKYKQEELIGKSLYDIYTNPEERNKLIEALINDGSVNEYELNLKDKDDTQRICSINSILIKDKNGIPIKIVGIMRDISDRKRAEKEKMELEEKLLRSKKMESLGLLAGGVAHDLNNVLSGIVGYPELLLLDLPEDSKLRKPIEIIQESGHSATAIVQDLLTVARGVATTKEVLNLNDLIGDYLRSPEFKKLEQFHPTATVKTNLNTDLLNISGSHVHIQKVVMNLVSNAAEAIEGSGNVTISTVNRYIDRPLRGYDDVNIGEYVVLLISDDGSGISSDDLERIFEPFYTKKVMGRSGTGLGLAVVWNVIQDHKGYIDVVTGENGTTFELYFPITRDEISDKTLSIPIKDYKGNGETILVVDDVESQREISCTMLDKLGYKTKAVSSGEEAVEYLNENTVDLVLLDMIMDPGINGRETYERIIKIHPKQKAIIISGFAQTDEVKEAQKLGAGQYIKKPVTLEKIGLAVQEELGK